MNSVAAHSKNPAETKAGGARTGAGRKPTIAPGEPTTNIMIRLPATLATSLKARAAAQGISLPALLRSIIASAGIDKQAKEAP